jgi:hypothetical protein
MSFINWSDSHEMLGLLSEFVVDERHDSTADPARTHFLSCVLEELDELTARIDETNDDDAIVRLRMILESVNDEFRGDRVLEHVQACIEELERIRDRVLLDGRPRSQVP